MEVHFATHGGHMSHLTWEVGFSPFWNSIINFHVQGQSHSLFLSQWVLEWAWALFLSLARDITSLGGGSLSKHRLLEPALLYCSRENLSVVMLH